MHVDYTVYETLCIVYETNNHFIKKKKKMGLTVLFTHIKIILMFSISVFNFQFSAK